MRITLTLPDNLSGKRLDQAVQSVLNTRQYLEHVSVKQVKKWLESGKIQVLDIEKTRPSYRVLGGESIKFSEDLVDLWINQKTAKRIHKLPSISHKKNQSKQYWDTVWQCAQKLDSAALSVLYIDEGLVIINKPSGIPTSPTIDPQRESLFHRVLNHVARLNKDDSMPYLRNVHRLDKDTSGLVMFSRSPEATKGMAHIFKQRMIDKRYQMICHRSHLGHLYEYINQISMREPRLKRTIDQPKLPWFEYKTYMNIESRKHHQIQKWMVTTQGGVYAQTDFRLIEKMTDTLMLEARLRTGRTHQIRVHLSSLSAPIIGDDLYGKAESCPLLLNASSLSFQHPLNGENVCISTELPSYFMEYLT